MLPDEKQWEWWNSAMQKALWISEDKENKNNDKTCVNIESTWQKMCFKKPKTDVWFWEFLDVFSWLIVNFFAIALMWSVVFAALKTSKVTEKIVSWIDHFWKSLASAAPIIPTPWWMMSIGWIKSWTNQAMHNIPSMILDKEIKDKISPYLDSLGWVVSWDRKDTEKLFEWVKWTSESDNKKFVQALWKMTSWSNVESYKSSLDAINSLLWWTSHSSWDSVLKDEKFVNYLSQNSDMNIQEFIDKYYSKWTWIKLQEDKQKVFDNIYKTISGWSYKSVKIKDSDIYYKINDFVYRIDPTTKTIIEQKNIWKDDLSWINLEQLKLLTELINNISISKIKDLWIKFNESDVDTKIFIIWSSQYKIKKDWDKFKYELV